MPIWIRKCSSFEEERQADSEFWRRLTPDERVAAVEQMRRERSLAEGHGEPRLRRVVRVLAASEG